MTFYFLRNFFRNLAFTKAEKDKSSTLESTSGTETLNMNVQPVNDENYEWKKLNNGKFSLIVKSNQYTGFEIELLPLTEIIIIQLVPGSITYTQKSNATYDQDTKFTSPGAGIFLDENFPEHISPTTYYTWQPKGGSKGLKFDLITVYDTRLVHVGIASKEATTYSYCAQVSNQVPFDESFVLRALNISISKPSYSISEIRNIHVDTMNFVRYSSSDGSTVGYEYESNVLSIYSPAYKIFRFLGGPATVSVKAPSSDFTYTIFDENGNDSEYIGSQDITINN